MKIPPKKDRARWGAVEWVRMRDGEQVLVFGDLHYDIADQKLVNALLNLAYIHKIGRFVFQGDSCDGFGVSRHKKESGRLYRHGALIAEGQALREGVLDACRALAKAHGGWVIYLPGNHDGRRIEDFISDNPALHGQSYVDLFGLREAAVATKDMVGVEFLNYGQMLRLGDLCIEHGDQLPGAKSGGVGTATKVLSKLPDQNTLYGHTHRVCEDSRDSYSQGKPRQFSAWNVGHLSDLEQQNYRVPREGGWQHGAAIVDFYEHKRKVLFNVNLLRAVDRAFYYQGAVYAG